MGPSLLSIKMGVSKVTSWKTVTKVFKDSFKDEHRKRSYFYAAERVAMCYWLCTGDHNNWLQFPCFSTGDIQKNRDGHYAYVPSEEEMVVDDETSITYYDNVLNAIMEKEAKAMARKVNGKLVGYSSEEDAVLEFYIHGSSYHVLEDAAHVLKREGNVTDANVIRPAVLQ